MDNMCIPWIYKNKWLHGGVCKSSVFFIKTLMVFFNECGQSTDGCVQGVDIDGIIQRL